ncbi:unnamed protein product [Thelazia callipaeda]|uniref:HECT-type E3 ubiquitin transferase n=1 Tax=Thelazia callipaeda TaxID=103827 RepID=A0A158RAP1_THECL|nr:unnamed protein product [Thelazia callipaeda]
MAGNLNLYDFNGSVRRNKLQDAIFSDMYLVALYSNFHCLLSKIYFNSRRKSAALKIQSAYRGYRIRKQFRNYLRCCFDDVGSVQSVCSLQTQISRLAFFFRTDVDCQRTITMCSIAVALAQTANAKDLLERRRRQQLLRCAVLALECIDETKLHAPLLRFFEIYIDEEDGQILLSSGFFSSVLSRLSKCHRLQSPLCVEEKLPQRTESLLEILVLPIHIFSKKSSFFLALFDALCQSKFEAMTVCCVVPFLARSCKTGGFNSNDVADAFLCGDCHVSSHINASPLLTAYCVIIVLSAFPVDKLNTTEKMKLTKTYAALVQKIALSSDTVLRRRQSREDQFSDSDDETTDTVMTMTPIVEPAILTTEFYLKVLISNLKVLLSNESFISALVNDGNGTASFCSLTYFIRSHSFSDYAILMNLFSSFRELFPCLWLHIMSLETNPLYGAAQLLVSLLERGESTLQFDEQRLLPPLSMFLTLMTNSLKTVDDDDFQSGGTGDAAFPFTLKETANVVIHCRDLTLGLIDLAFPVKTRLFQHQQCSVRSSKWSDLFENVTGLTRALYERDSRVHFMPSNFWSSHNRTVVISSLFWRAGNGRRLRTRRPFEFVRFLLRSRDTDASQDPPTAEELRNVFIVRNIPFVIPFMQRIEIFTELLHRDRMQHDNGQSGHVILARRATLYEDAFRALQPHIVSDMKSTIRVQMVNWAGLEEAGIDGGGIFREFLFELVQTALDPCRGFFSATHEQLLYPNPLAPFLYPNNFMDHFYFLGRIIAKLIYEGLLIDIRFADFFLLQWVRNPDDIVLDLESMKSYDPLLHRNLNFLKRCSPEEIDSLDLEFTVLNDNFGVMEKVELKTGGSFIKVTVDNRMEYIQLYVNYYLSKRLSPMISALRNGLRNVIDPQWLQMFSPHELSMLIGGIDSQIDFTELKKFTTVHNIKCRNHHFSFIYCSEHDQLYIEQFWKVINGFSAGNKKKLLKFITGCPRPPIMGFKTLTPPMGIQLVHDVDKLPTAATCMNLLKLPLYKDAETLHQKLIYAVNCGAGFELT